MRPVELDDAKAYRDVGTQQRIVIGFAMDTASLRGTL